MKVSVIIPCYDEEACLDDCLRTITRQSLSEYEVIVVDDGSLDRSREVASHYPVTLLQASHQGPGAARNLGARHSTGEILVFVDADMSFDERYLEMLTAPVRKREAIGTFHRDERVANPRNPWAHCWTLHSGLPLGRRLPPDMDSRSTVFRAILRTEFERAGGFDNAGYEDDTSLSSRLGETALAADGAVCYHHNPGTLRDVFLSSRWIGKGLARWPRGTSTLAMMPLALVKGLLGAVRYRFLPFLIFRPVYDFGLLCGLVMRRLGTGHAK